ncbi:MULTISPECIES: hypothetical protein [Streptosporangium]|uniref:XRE family transcriptional regulator n=1 Tax=Streptosporangium brasiliense TaxID=47480 RepID=A0ABT9R1A8_9ACTN|nr:hypothetical protein [Streptosporangium brasiliense]MDP9862988.1 hypothetical protein [Streptosporangium brasiliense]
MSDDRELRVALSEGPFHVALRAAVEARGLTLDRLRQRLEERGLRVGMTSLSYWQQGLRRPERPESLRAVRALEEILILPPRSLMGLLGPPRPRGRGQSAGPAAGAGPYPSAVGPARALSTLLHELDGVADDRRLHIAGMYESLQIGADRSTTRRETLQVVQAHEDAADRYIMVYRGDIGCDVERVRIRALEDCRVGRVRRDGPTALVVAELLFDRALRTGDTQVMRYELADPSGVEATEYERGFRFPAGQYVLRVSFAPEALPVSVRRFARHESAAGEHDQGELALNAHHAVHLVTGSLQPGLVGIRWKWS